MGIYKKIRETWKKPKETISELMKERLMKWRKEQSSVRIERPTRLDRARSLGYRAKQGILIIRQRVLRNTPMRPTMRKGRGSKSRRLKKIISVNLQRLCEQRVQKKHPNLEVLNSYFVGKDPKNAWYEVIMIDPVHPAILKDKTLSRIAKQRRRVQRGLTSSAKKSRGLIKK